VGKGKNTLAGLSDLPEGLERSVACDLADLLEAYDFVSAY